jgi:peptide/nickel transport system substrate-binding protein
MRSRWLAVSSGLLLLAAAAAARAETRPHYGGTLRIETQTALDALPSPAPGAAFDRLAEQVARLIYDARDPAAPPKPGSGPFRVAEFVPGKKLALVANDDYAGGRPYLDGVEIQMGRTPREQMVALQLGRADVIDVPAEMMRRAAQEGVRLVSAAPLELVAIVFSAGAGEDARVREALSLSADRAAIFNVLLGRQGEPAAALLPGWMTGYAFLFDASQNVTRARQLAVEAGRARPLTLAYDAQDPLLRAIAERIALDARSAGLSVTPAPASRADARLVRIALPGRDAPAALEMLATALGARAEKVGPSPEDWYAAERRLREELRIVPLLHLPLANGVAPRVKNWPASQGGAWPLADVWLEARP